MDEFTPEQNEPDPKYVRGISIHELKYLMPRLDWDSAEMEKTHDRWAKMMTELTSRYDHGFQFTTFDSDVDEMVIVKGIDFVTLCAHHLVPFIGKCDIAYVPQGKIAGLSKFPRLVNWFAHGAWNQESLTSTIADAIDKLLNPLGVAVIMEAEHLCMTIRGVQAAGTTTVTSAMKGCFADHSKKARQEFLYLRRDK